METENDLLNLLLKSPNSASIKPITERLEIKLIIIFPLVKIEMI